MSSSSRADRPPTGAPPGAGSLLGLLKDGVPRTRSELAEITGLARSTVAQRVDTLLHSGLLLPDGEASSTGGRPPTRFRFNAGARTVLAVDIGASHLQVGLADLRANLRSRHRESLQITDGPEPVLERLIAIADTLITAEGMQRSDLAGAAIGLPGPVEHSSGRLINPPIMPGWHGFDVPGFVRERLGVEVLVDNDVNIMALGEHFTAHPQVNDFMLVKVSTGIGSGIISDGALRRGAQGGAGDLGHIQVPGGEPRPCTCGNVGCLEALASGAAIAAALREAGIAARNNADVVALARAGSVDATRLVREAGRHIGEVLAAAVSLLNPSVIVVSGALADSGDHLLAGIREVVYRRSLPLATAHLRIVPSAAGPDAAMVGAAVEVIDHVLAPDTIDAHVATTRSG